MYDRKAGKYFKIKHEDVWTRQLGLRNEADSTRTFRVGFWNNGTIFPTEGKSKCSVVNSSDRTNLGLALSDTVPVIIFRFLKPVTDVQLWLLNSDPAGVVVEAHQDYHTLTGFARE